MFSPRLVSCTGRCFCFFLCVRRPLTAPALVDLGKIKSVVRGGRWYLVSGLFDGDGGGADALIASGDVELAPGRKAPGAEKRKRRPDSPSYDMTRDGIG